MTSTSYFDTRDDRTAPDDGPDAAFPASAIVIVRGLRNAHLPDIEIVHALNASNRARLDGRLYTARDVEVLAGIPSTRPCELEEQAS